MSFLDKVTYGNLTLEYKEAAEKDDLSSRKLKELDLYDDLFNHPPPNNSSKTTLEELKSVVRLIANTTKQELKFCKLAENDHLQLFMDLLDKHNITDTRKEDLNRITSELDPINYRLKNHYNRPRPYQLAHYYKLDLHIPITTNQIDHPAYPSGHALEGYVLSHLLAAKYPQHKKELLRLGKNIGLSRLHIGVHYKSDYDFGVYLGKIIIDNKLMKL